MADAKRRLLPAELADTRILLESRPRAIALAADGVADRP